ncbi:MAG: hypothetical protein DMF88_14670 [Acidobacteria bacterium]|nr:MAG: hypothetical protein DMF88_14670 [Acidobacteriota bacterium]
MPSRSSSPPLCVNGAIRYRRRDVLASAPWEVPMADVSAVLAANREAVSDLIAASDRCSACWTAPRAPGKWSPSQIVEHVARSIEESANMMAGAPTKFVTLPFFVRPLARTLLFKRVLRTGGFPKAKTNKAMNPASGPAMTSEARTRLEGALARFDRELRARAQSSDSVTSSAFGTVPLTDYARFIEIHTRHHTRQMPAVV